MAAAGPVGLAEGEDASLDRWLYPSPLEARGKAARIALLCVNTDIGHFRGGPLEFERVWNILLDRIIAIL